MRAFEDRPGYPLKRERSGFGRSGGRSMHAVKGKLFQSPKKEVEESEGSQSTAHINQHGCPSNESKSNLALKGRLTRLVGYEA